MNTAIVPNSPLAVQPVVLIPVDGELRVDSRLIAQRLGVKNISARKLIEQYRSDFEEFGVSVFEIEKPPEDSTGGRPEKFYLLNEDQAYLLLTYSQNTPQARSLKIQLVKSFGEYRRCATSAIDYSRIENQLQRIENQLSSLSAPKSYKRGVHKLNPIDEEFEKVKAYVEPLSEVITSVIIDALGLRSSKIRVGRWLSKLGWFCQVRRNFDDLQRVWFRA